MKGSLFGCSLRSSLATAVLGFGLLVWARTTRAEDATATVTAKVAILASGPGSPDVSKSVKASLPRGIAVVDSAAVLSTMASSGLLASPKLPLDTKDTEALRRVAVARQVDAFVVVRVEVTKRARRVDLEIFDVSRPEAYQEHTVRLGLAPAAADEEKIAEFTHVLSGLLPAGAVTSVLAPSPTPSPGVTPAPVALSTTSVTRPPRPEGDPAYSLTTLALAFDAGTRNFSYHDGLTSNLHSYSGSLALGAAVSAEIYPFADSGTILNNLGVKADYRAAIGFGSKAPSGTLVHTAWTAFDILLRYRIRFAKVRPPVLGLVFGYGREDFVFALPFTQFPSAAYPTLHVGGDFRYPFGRSSVTVAGDYLPGLSALYIAENFRHPSSYGLDASVTYAYRIAPLVELTASAALTRYIDAFQPKPGDAWVAGGAVDQMFHGQVGARVIY